jgi:hypothetical protein
MTKPKRPGVVLRPTRLPEPYHKTTVHLFDRHLRFLSKVSRLEQISRSEQIRQILDAEIRRAQPWNAP